MIPTSTAHEDPAVKMNRASRVAHELSSYAFAHENGDHARAARHKATALALGYMVGPRRQSPTFRPDDDNRSASADV